MKEKFVQIRGYAEAVERLGIAVIDFEAECAERGGIDAPALPGPVVAFRIPAPGEVAFAAIVLIWPWLIPWDYLLRR